MIQYLCTELAELISGRISYVKEQESSELSDKTSELSNPKYKMSAVPLIFCHYVENSSSENDHRICLDGLRKPRKHKVRIAGASVKIRTRFPIIKKSRFTTVLCTPCFEIVLKTQV